MNKEIKFRAWYPNRKPQLGMCRVTCIDYEGQSKPFVRLSNGTVSTFANLDEVVLMQYSGLKDKNEKEIYEGDIVSVLDDNNVFEVKFGKVKRNIVGFDTDTIFPIEIN